ncbi:MAG: integrase arm-type DNA-binding domain-containing protein [Candidatus Hydrogenedentes bacterium]|nr:integrase arm-type DNA-binding domain-containing protein [Candidatus Hydrogenedentota bacterium]
MKLTDAAIRAAVPTDKTTRMIDGDGLYLVVYSSGRKSFEYRYVTNGKLKPLILGTYGTRDGELTLKEARLERDRLKALRNKGGDPALAAKLESEQQRLNYLEAKAAVAAARREQAAERELAVRQALTFQIVADEWIEHKRPTWTEAHAHQVEQSFRDHVYALIGSRPVDSIQPADVIRVVEDMLAKGKIETARRVHQRLGEVFEYAAVLHKTSGNPVAAAKRLTFARIKAATAANPEESHPCVPPAEVPQLLRAMHSYVGTPVTRTLLWFVAMTACRTGEARFATWDEFDLNEALWTVPASRMKAGREHVVPLAPAVLTLLKSLKLQTGGKPFVFAHPRRDDRPASENAILYALAAIGYESRMTGHGFRQLFSTLANESGLWRSDVIELALAHRESDAVRAAYNKAQYNAERRKLMEWYADELAGLRASDERVAA